MILEPKSCRSKVSLETLDILQLDLPHILAAFRSHNNARCISVTAYSQDYDTDAASVQLSSSQLLIWNNDVLSF
jgi:hypothetical protein